MGHRGEHVPAEFVNSQVGFFRLERDYQKYKEAHKNEDVLEFDMWLKQVKENYYPQ